MFQQFIYKYKKPEKDKVEDVLFDIELFFNYLERYGQVINVWYFQNIFSEKYWQFLKNYNWLDSEKQDYLHQGILSMVLFQCHQHLEGISKLKENRITSMETSLKRFKSDNVTSNKLHRIVIDAIEIIKNGNVDVHKNSGAETQIYSSVLWTLKNVILKDLKMNKRE